MIQSTVTAAPPQPPCLSPWALWGLYSLGKKARLVYMTFGVDAALQCRQTSPGFSPVYFKTGAWFPLTLVLLFPCLPMVLAVGEAILSTHLNVSV